MEGIDPRAWALGRLLREGRMTAQVPDMCIAFDESDLRPFEKMQDELLENGYLRLWAYNKKVFCPNTCRRHGHFTWMTPKAVQEFGEVFWKFYQGLGSPFTRAAECWPHSKPWGRGKNRRDVYYAADTYERFIHWLSNAAANPEYAPQADQFLRVENKPWKDNPPNG